MSKFVGDSKEFVVPQCHHCAHYRGDLKCNAFDRIPREIFANHRDHRRPYPQDNGVRFKAVDEAGKVYVESLFD